MFNGWEITAIIICFLSLVVFIVHKTKSTRRYDEILKDFNGRRFDEDKALRLLKLRYGKKSDCEYFK